jgi:hypothetical protein
LGSLLPCAQQILPRRCRRGDDAMVREIIIDTGIVSTLTIHTLASVRQYIRNSRPHPDLFTLKTERVPSMIRSLRDIADLAREKGPMRVAVLAPEDEEFMLAVKRSWQKGFIEPVLIGNRERIEQEPLAKLFRIPWSRRVRLVPTRPFLQQKPSDLVNSLILSVFRHCLDAPLLLMSFSNDVFRNPGQVASLIS